MIPLQAGLRRASGNVRVCHGDKLGNTCKGRSENRPYGEGLKRRRRMENLVSPTQR